MKHVEVINFIIRQIIDVAVIHLTTRHNDVRKLVIHVAPLVSLPVSGPFMPTSMSTTDDIQQLA